MEPLPKISTYVHDNKTPREIDAAIDKLRSEIHDPSASLSTCDFAELRSALLRLTKQLKDLRRPGKSSPGAAKRTSSPSGDLSLFDSATEHFEISLNGAAYESFKDFEEQVTPIVASRNDAELNKAFAEFRTAMRSAAGNGNDGFVNYFTLFVPSAQQFKEEKPSLLKLLLQWLRKILKKAIASLQNQMREVWTILRDPDAYYLRLRGEIHELARKEPDLAWLHVLVFLPDLFRLYARLLFDGKVAAEVKLQLVAAIAYLVLPFDLLPEALLGPIGYAEDAFLLAKVILDLTNEKVIPKERLQMHWSGTPDTLDKMIAFSGWFSENLDFFRIIGDWFKTAHNPV